ncbi:helix-turn-helix domain-containing protein [Enterobacter hormaechei]|uniref:helix-turn-helix domain-containing protein n=2 Tax=Enterobacteriaceae TaxID=543 RepID=UPI001FFB1140|nr:helix-turn-helix domain-containing protein [Enterobacter hormaechei]
MSGRRFGRLPNWWSRSANGDDFLLMSLKSNDTGTGIAAMKCLLAVSVLIDFHSRIAEVSLSGMEELTGLSRPMVIRGLARLEELGVVVSDKDYRTNRYELTIKSNDSYWAKVPVDTVRKRLKTISNRGIAPFTALKLYITILNLRYKDKTTVQVMHDTLRNYTGIQTNQVRHGLDVLYSSALLHLMPREDRATNEYQILGL